MGFPFPISFISLGHLAQIMKPDLAILPPDKLHQLWSPTTKQYGRLWLFPFPISFISFGHLAQNSLTSFGHTPPIGFTSFGRPPQSSMAGFGYSLFPEKLHQLWPPRPT